MTDDEDSEDSYKKPTLDEFIKEARSTKVQSIASVASWVIEPGFSSLYVRYGSRYILFQTSMSNTALFNESISVVPPKYNNVLDLSNITAEEDRRGQGVFTRLVFRLRKDYPGVHLYVENAMEERFRRHLLKIGFSETMYNGFFLEAKKT